MITLRLFIFNDLKYQLTIAALYHIPREFQPGKSEK